MVDLRWRGRAPRRRGTRDAALPRPGRQPGHLRRVRLASCLKQVGGEHRTVPDALRAYQFARWWPTTRLLANSRILGFLETQSGPGALFRDAFFFTTGKVGIAKFVFLDAATIKA